MRIPLLVQAVALSLWLGGPVQPMPPAPEVAAALQKKYDRIADFTADFVHEAEGGLLRKKQIESGTVRVKKPGKMRWDYKSPEPKLFLSDGHRIYLHVPADNQVIISPVPEQDQATTAVLFLVGKGNLTRDFTVTYADGGGPDTYALRLQPKLPERDYDWLQLVVDRRTLQIRTLTAADSQGGRSTFQFSNFKENTGLSDKTFTFKIPRGADVTNNGVSSR
jgi:outer membrane lipoprotein carrier protein